MKLRVEYFWIDGTGWGLPVLLFAWSMLAVLIGYVRYIADDTAIPVVCLLLAVMATFHAVTMIANKTTIMVTAEQIEIMNGPIPWFGDKVIDVATIHNFAWKERGNARGVGTNFAFYCTLPDGKRINLFSGVHIGKPQEARRVLEKVSNWLAKQRRIEIVQL
jgi:hypothetical protein